MVTRDEFKAIEDRFLETLDDELPNERWDTRWSQAADVLQALRGFLFKDEIAKEARRKQWEELKKEFGS